jgi:hypothetical protein
MDFSEKKLQRELKKAGIELDGEEIVAFKRGFKELFKALIEALVVILDVLISLEKHCEKKATSENNDLKASRMLM